MSRQQHKSGDSRRGEMQSYVTGFILSLIFTLIPYYLVVNQSTSGTKLMMIIVGFGFIQLIIQATFFLHLGRGPKPKWDLFFLVSTVGMCLVVVGGSVFIINQLYKNMSPAEQIQKLADDENIYQVGGAKTGACEQLHDNHQVVITNGVAAPLQTNAHKCDTLTFINKDKVVREIAFGPHDDHVPYAGNTEIALKSGQNETITLSELGTINFHDHLQEETAGAFTVSP